MHMVSGTLGLYKQVTRSIGNLVRGLEKGRIEMRLRAPVPVQPFRAGISLANTLFKEKHTLIKTRTKLLISKALGPQYMQQMKEKFLHTPFTNKHTLLRTHTPYQVPPTIWTTGMLHMQEFSSIHS